MYDAVQQNINPGGQNLGRPSSIGMCVGGGGGVVCAIHAHGLDDSCFGHTLIKQSVGGLITCNLNKRIRLSMGSS